MGSQANIAAMLDITKYEQDVVDVNTKIISKAFEDIR